MEDTGSGSSRRMVSGRPSQRADHGIRSPLSNVKKFRSGRIMKGFLLGIVTDPETDERVPTVWRLIPSARGFAYPAQRRLEREDRLQVGPGR
jgi:hypothetical protein